MLLAEKYMQADSNTIKNGEQNAGRREGLDLAVRIIKLHKNGLSDIQIAMDCNCGLNEVEAVTANI